MIMKDNEMYIINRKEVNKLIKQHGNKTKACSFIAEQTVLNADTLYNKVGICNPKKRTVPYSVASGLLIHRAGIEKPYDFSHFILDVKRTLILMNSTGVRLFKTNEKTILTIMLLFNQKEWWSAKELTDKAAEAGSAGISQSIIEKVLKKMCRESYVTNKGSKCILIEDNNTYSIDIDNLIHYIEAAPCVDNSFKTILT